MPVSTWLLRQVFQRAAGDSVVLDEHEVPEFNHERRAFVDEMPARAVVGQVNVDFTAWTARAGLAHFPEIILLVEPQYVYGDDVGHFRPQFMRLVICAEYFGVEPLLRKFPDSGEQFPRPANRLPLAVIAERPVAEHFEERMVIRVAPDFFEIVVSAGDADALLRVRRARVVARSHAEEHVLKLVHPGVGKEQRRVALRDDGRAWHDAVRARMEKIKE